ncbi:MAG: TlpA family protein disulfide reductase [Chlorobi bacterium]|nr:TlpA family protein disulfide reductase [Chlorobiota bacterium]
MKIKEKIAEYKKKPLKSKISDAVFIVFIIVMLTPSGRLAVGGFANRIKAMFVQPSVKTGKNIPRLGKDDYNWYLKDIYDNTVNLSDFKNKVLFINYWATWCPPCVGEMPEIQSLYEDFKDNEDIEFLLITSDTPDKAKAFTKKKHYNFPIYFFSSPAPEILKSNVIPATFIISKKGEIRVSETGASHWNGERTRKLLKTLISE